ncbi:MAG: hypothetical protein JSR93_03810, partial [Verrucomicrobia bacterium]|nr:hypothetical protein [Verrucomicrobiota bacterium]
MSRYFTEEEGQTAKWDRCIFCRKQWMLASLELELCPYCLEALRDRPDDYDEVKLEQFLKLGDFEDQEMA